MLPSEVLAYSQLRPAHFGVAEGLVGDPGEEQQAVDLPGNVVYNTVAAAQIKFDDIVTDQSDSARAEIALVYFTLSRLYGVLADQKAQFVGLTTQRGGQVSTPIGSYTELMSAANRNYQEAKNLYPDAPWPPIDGEASGGSVKVPRSYVP